MLVRDNLVLDNRETVRLLGTRLYEQGKLSFRRSRIAGYTKRIIMELLGRYNASVFNYDEQNWKMISAMLPVIIADISCLILPDKIQE